MPPLPCNLPGARGVKLISRKHFGRFMVPAVSWHLVVQNQAISPNMVISTYWGVPDCANINHNLHHCGKWKVRIIPSGHARMHACTHSRTYRHIDIISSSRLRRSSCFITNSKDRVTLDYPRIYARLLAQPRPG